MIPYVRQSQIYSYIKMKQIAYIDELLDLTKVSLPTVRRDLKKLEEEGKIILLNGGGVKLSEEEKHSVVARLEVQADEKYLICNKAASLLENDEFIYVGPGTTEDYLIGFFGGEKHHSSHQWHLSCAEAVGIPHQDHCDRGEAGPQLRHHLRP